MIQQTTQPLDINDPQPGIYYDVPFEKYLSISAMSQSVLKNGEKSMSALKAAYDGELRKKPTDAMILGSALHLAFLEPTTAIERVTVYNETRRGKKWEEFKAANAGRIILTGNQFTALEGMTKSLRSHPYVRDWVTRTEAVEVTRIADVHGVRCKTRIDALTDDPIVDIKKVARGDEHSFSRAIYDFGYDIQAALYSAVWNRDRFAFLTVEDSPPYEVTWYELSDEWLGIGRWRLQNLLVSWHNACQRHEWPVRDPEPVTIHPPKWVEDQFQTAGGIQGEF